jgi:excisionase family DNA binding protein
VARDEILTLQEVADLLKVGVKTAYTFAQDGRLPGFKVGQQWRFKLVDIDKWIDAQKAAQKKPSPTKRATKTATRRAAR